ncbi:PD40 domain-containing protein [candidate division KSB1 bacterium]|nr:PD40 domain-containing protein [candidate division KSB1 bacterium]
MDPVLVDTFQDTIGINTWAWDWCPFITADGSTLYFSSNRAGHGDFDLYVSTRNGDGWTQPARLPFCQEGVDERNPTVALGDDTLYFVSMGNDWDIFWSFRTGYSDTSWGAPECLPEPINSSGIEFAVCATPDNARLLFSSWRGGGMGGEDFYECRRDTMSGTGWSAPSLLPGRLNTFDIESYPSMGLDTAELFFWGRSDQLCVSHLTDSGWTIGEALPENINRVLARFPTETTPCVTADGRRLYFASRFGDPPTAGDIWYSDRMDSSPAERRGTQECGVLRVYPNPTNGGLVASLPQHTSRLLICNLLGRRVADVPLGDYRPFQQVDLTSIVVRLPSGAYWLHASTEGRPMTSRFLVTK